MINYSIRTTGYTILNALIILILLFASFTHATVASNFDQDQLDQEQSFENSFENFYAQKCLAQSFIPTLENLTRIQLNLSKSGDISSDIIVIIKKINFISPEIINVTIPGSKIVGKAWYQVNFTKTILDISQRYFIICKTLAGDENNCYNWHASDFDNYANGNKYTSSDNGENWFEDNSTDFCFKTFGKELERETKLEIQYITGGSGAQLNFGIKNVGEATIHEIYYNLIINGGLILTGRQYANRTITTSLGIKPGEIVNWLEFPIIGFGLKININLTVWTDDSDPVSMEKQGFFFLFYLYVKY